MIDFIKDYKNNGKPWIILGKGPSFNRINEVDLSRYNTLSLNEVCAQVKVDIAHIIDLDVLDRVKDLLEENARILLMPYFPHVGCRPNPRISLHKIIETYPVLKRLYEKGRLFCYDLSTSPIRWGGSTVIKASNFSAEAAVNLLAEIGAKEIRTLGIDGGKDQSKTFSHLKNHNTERGYDKQWANIRRCIRKYNLLFGPVYLDCPVRVFVGCSESELIPYSVLKYTIEKNSTISVQVEPLHKWMEKIPEVKDPALRARTPFSFQRFLIPEICEFKGRAIYLDSDMQVFYDIRDLWERPMEGFELLVPRSKDEGRRKAQFSVFVVNCSINWKINEIIELLNTDFGNYSRIMHEMALANSRIEGVCQEWNELEHYEEGKTKLLHYTDFHTQPWKIESHPLGKLWEKSFREAHKQGYLTTEQVKEHTDKGFVRASLLSLLDQQEHLPASIA